ncbi:MAG TPA: hypothetical protein VK842_01700, partial [bacterium]|nr:hypothetical protein [bacterium]
MKNVKLVAALLLLAGFAGPAAAFPCLLANGQAASFALGQPDLVSTGVNNGGAGPASINQARKSFSDGTRLFVADTNNNRILIYNSLPTLMDQAADLVLGQPDFTSIQPNQGGAASASTLWFPGFVFYDGTRLYEAESGNNRVLIWNSLPTVNDQPADLVLGQADFTQNAINRGGSTAANSLYYPWSVTYRGGQLVVTDSFNNRILIWNSLPATNGQAADLVVGQPDFTSNAPGTGANHLLDPNTADISGSNLIVADTNNNRCLVFSPVPTANGASASGVVGQSDFNSVAANAGGLSASSIDYVPAFTVDADGNLWVADDGNNRVLRYNGIPNTFAPPATLVLGQADFASNQPNRSGSTTVAQANGLYMPYDVNVAGADVFVNEYGNSRISVFTCPPTPTPTASPSGPACAPANGQAATFALGQPDLVSNVANNGGVGASSLFHSQRSFSDGTRLFVADSDNNRVLIYNSLPSSMAQPADLVLGQADFTGNLP